MLRVSGHRSHVVLVSRPIVALSAAIAGAGCLLGVRQAFRLPRRAAEAASEAQSQARQAEVNVEYLRHMYASTRGWYAAAETKAQLLLAVNGIFVTVLFGILFGLPGDARVNPSRFKIDTWVLIGLSVTALVAAILCATLCLWSLHGRAKTELAKMETDSEEELTSHKPEAFWYFGHIASMPPSAVREKLCSVDHRFEIEVLSYHVIDLARKVLRKYQWVNAGWAFTALALIALAAAGGTFFLQAQF
jgi:pycsar effector protein